MAWLLEPFCAYSHLRPLACRLEGEGVIRDVKPPGKGDRKMSRDDIRRMMGAKTKKKLVSVPEELMDAFDAMWKRRGYRGRSTALTSVIGEWLEREVEKD